MSAQLDALDLALLAGLREIAGRRTARRANMTVLDGGGAMVRWGRRRGDLFAQWHLLTGGANARGIFVAACGESLGDRSTSGDIEQVDDESVIGNRCPSCQGAALRGDPRGAPNPP